MKVALSIAGSDSSAGAGVQADLLTFSAMGVYGTTAITALTAQNPENVFSCVATEPELLKEQIQAVLSYYNIGAIKTGLLCNSALMNTVYSALKEASDIPLVVDPVMVSSSGTDFLNNDAIDAYKNIIFPIATVITPNLDEAEVLCGTKASNVDEMKDIACALSKSYDTAVLLKGGHMSGDVIYDILALSDGTVSTTEKPRVDGINSHGSGCTVSAAITAALAMGLKLAEAVDAADTFIRASFQNPINISNEKFLNHSPDKSSS